MKTLPDSAQVERQIWSQTFELIKADIRKPVWQLLTDQVHLRIEGQVIEKLSSQIMSQGFMLHVLVQVIVRRVVMHIEERVRDSMALAEEQDWLSSEDQAGSVSEAVRNQAGEDYDA